jgi:hypothetical protein
VRVHDGLRAELRALQEATADGREPERDGRSLLTHCAAFCGALTRHHTGEDTHAFPALAGQFPDLVPLIDKLREDHELIAVVIGRIEAASGTPRLRGELDGLAAIVESHFAVEERRIVEALDALATDLPASTLYGVDPRP